MTPQGEFLSEAGLTYWSDNQPEGPTHWLSRCTMAEWVITPLNASHVSYANVVIRVVEFAESVTWSQGATSHASQEPWPWNCESPKESVQRPSPTHLQNHVVWSRTFKCSVKPYVTRSSNKCYFNEFLFMRGSSHMIKSNKSTVVSVRNAMVSQFCVRPTSKKWFWKESKCSWNMVRLMPCRNPCGLYNHLAFTLLVGPSSVVWSELGPGSAFSTNESAWSALVTGPQSRVWSGPKLIIQFIMVVVPWAQVPADPKWAKYNRFSIICKY